MSDEVKTPVEKLTDGEGEPVYIIRYTNTIADIARLAISEGWADDLVTQLTVMKGDL